LGQFSPESGSGDFGLVEGLEDAQAAEIASDARVRTRTPSFFFMATPLRNRTPTIRGSGRSTPLRPPGLRPPGFLMNRSDSRCGQEWGTFALDGADRSDVPLQYLRRQVSSAASMKILAVSGSLRAASSNGTLLRALPLVSPPDMKFTFRAPLDALPYFNPDIEQEGLPQPVAHWRAEIRDHAALVICSPEYAHGVPGVLKNALDWLVGGVEITAKPIAVFQTSLPSTIAHASLLEILRVMGGNVIPEASVPVLLRGRKLDEHGIASDSTLSTTLHDAMTALSSAVSTSRRD
jgi:NAD(P)H-dependent FMN reductase